MSAAQSSVAASIRASRHSHAGRGKRSSERRVVGQAVSERSDDGTAGQARRDGSEVLRALLGSGASDPRDKRLVVGDSDPVARGAAVERRQLAFESCVHHADTIAGDDSPAAGLGGLGVAHGDDGAVHPGERRLGPASAARTSSGWRIWNDQACGV